MKNGGAERKIIIHSAMGGEFIFIILTERRRGRCSLIDSGYFIRRE